VVTADGGTPIRDYKIQRKVNSGSWVDYDTVTNLVSPSYTDENLTPGDTYSYIVKARNDYYLSDPSSEFVLTAGFKPDSPSNL